jgi:hypothetical protein
MKFDGTFRNHLAQQSMQGSFIGTKSISFEMKELK